MTLKEEPLRERVAEPVVEELWTLVDELAERAAADPASLEAAETLAAVGTVLRYLARSRS